MGFNFVNKFIVFRIFFLCKLLINRENFGGYFKSDKDVYKEVDD